MVGSVHSPVPGSTVPGGAGRSTAAADGSFGAVFQKELEQARAKTVEFSKHALSRAEERGITLTPTLLDRLNDSVERRRPRGPRTSWPWTRAWRLLSTSPTDGSSPLCRKTR